MSASTRSNNNNATTENSTSSEDKFFDCLPEKLRCHLLPFQREGVAFGIRRCGRYCGIWTFRSLALSLPRAKSPQRELSLPWNFRVTKSPNHQIWVNRTKSEIPSTKSGPYCKVPAVDQVIHITHPLWTKVIGPNRRHPLPNWHHLLTYLSKTSHPARFGSNLSWHCQFTATMKSWSKVNSIISLQTRTT